MVIGPQQWKLAGVQVGVAALVAFAAWRIQENIEASADGPSRIEILFDPTFWGNFATFVLTYLTIAAGLGWIVGVGVALGLLAGVAAVRAQWLIVMLVIPAAGAALAVVGALLVA